MVAAAHVILRTIAALIAAVAPLATATIVTAAITFSTGLMVTIPGLVHVLPGATDPSADIFTEPFAPLWVIVATIGFVALDARLRPHRRRPRAKAPRGN